MRYRAALLGGERCQSRLPVRRRVWAAFVVAVVAVGAAGCAYQYDDGLPPLGQRDAAANATASATAATSAAAANRGRRPQAARGTGTAAPLGQPLTGDALSAWASTMLPDTSGMSLAADAGSVWPGRDPWRTGVDAGPGAATLHVACRGPGLARVQATAGDAELLDLRFACNREWTRPVDVPAAGHLDLQFGALGNEAANVAYRLTRP